MASFQLSVKPNRRAAARFVNRVRRTLQESVVADRERIGITQTKIADAIGVHRSVISRELNGRQDITLGRVAELAWALGREIKFELQIPKLLEGQNVPETLAGVLSSNNTQVIGSEDVILKAEHALTLMPSVARMRVASYYD